MNIVKLRDIVMPDEFRLARFFNKNLKGKYAYWVQMRYIFPLESLDYRTYIAYEQLNAEDFLKLLLENNFANTFSALFGIRVAKFVFSNCPSIKEFTFVPSLREPSFYYSALCYPRLCIISISHSYVICKVVIINQFYIIVF